MAVDFDIERMFREKRPNLARWIPRWGYALIRRILHEREVQAVFSEAGERKGYDLVRYLLDAFDIRIRVEGKVPASDDGETYTICANHPTGGWDAMALFYWMEQWRPNSVILANDVLGAIEGLRSLFFLVDVFAGTRDTIHALGELYASEQTVILFPAGRTSRPSKDGFLEEYPWNHMFVRKSRQCNRKILPVRISGRNSKRFYRIWHWRRRLGIEKTIEMFLLVDEMIRRRGEEIVLTVGECFDANDLNAQHSSDHDTADWLRRYTQSLGAK